MSEAGPLWRLGAEEIARGVRAGERSAAAVVDACLGRTVEVEPKIDAYLSLFADEARERAAAIDRRIAAGDEVGAAGRGAGGAQGQPEPRRRAAHLRLAHPHRLPSRRLAPPPSSGWWRRGR